MRYVIFLPVLAVLGQAEAVNLSGNWEAEAIRACMPGERCLKVLPSKNEMTLELHAELTTLKGTAIVGNWGVWPGTCDISDGKIEGNRFSFTLTGRSPWWSRSAAGVETHGYPAMRITGMVEGDAISFTFELFDHGPGWDSFRTEMKGRRVQE
jgi:hypothetical protein